MFHYCDSHFHKVRRLSCLPKCNTCNAQMVESWTQVARNETILSLPISSTHALFWLLEVFLGVAKIISFFFSLLFGLRERIIWWTVTNAWPSPLNCQQSGYMLSVKKLGPVQNWCFYSAELSPKAWQKHDFWVNILSLVR